MAWLYFLILFLLLLCGLVLTVMTLPGLWLMVFSAAIYAVVTHGQFIGFRTLIVLLALALVAEIVETRSAGVGAKKAGGGRPGFWGALIGGIVGGIFLTVIPIPIISTLIGVCLGTFLGAMIGEIAFGRDALQSARIGFGAAKGRLTGTIAKLGFGSVMFVLTMAMALPIRGHKSVAATRAAPVVTSQPTSR